MEEPTASLDHNKLPDFNELKKGKKGHRNRKYHKGDHLPNNLLLFLSKQKRGKMTRVEQLYVGYKKKLINC